MTTARVATLPRISVIVPSYNQGHYLNQALASIFDQKYPDVEVIVMDGGSTDDSVRIIQAYARHLKYWQSQPDGGQSAAINAGVKHATGELVAWLNSDDFYWGDALWHVGHAYACNPRRGFYVGNGYRYAEEEKRFTPFSTNGPHLDLPAFITGLDYLLQPASFFLRAAWTAAGGLDESLHYCMDWDILIRLATSHPVVLIQEYLAVSREYSDTKTSQGGLVRAAEIQRMIARHQPASITPGIALYHLDTLIDLAAHPSNIELRQSLLGARDVVARLIDRVHGTTHGFPKHSTRPVVYFVPKVPSPRPTEPARTFFCSLQWPRTPGHSGGEIRDFHLMTAVLEASTIEFFSLTSQTVDDRIDKTMNRVAALHFPESMTQFKPRQNENPASIQSKLMNTARKLQWRALSRARYPLEIASFASTFRDHFRFAMLDRLHAVRPHFLFISSQVNPAALELPVDDLSPRLIQSSYDVETIRIRRLAGVKRGLRRLSAQWDVLRSARFERANLACFDGLIAVSALDKQLFVELHGFPAQRILVADNGVDADYFAFQARLPRSRPEIVFTASFTYEPNRAAAMRLHSRIMPLLRRSHPQARLWLIGQQPGPELQALHDGEHTCVTGKVDDVRPYLAQATLACIPIEAGSGTKLKMLEAFSAGVPVVGSPLAVEGLDAEPGRHLLLASTDHEFAASAAVLIDSPDRCRAMCEESRRLIESHYTWHKTLSGLWQWLEEIRAMPKRRGQDRCAA